MQHDSSNQKMEGTKAKQNQKRLRPEVMWCPLLITFQNFSVWPSRSADCIASFASCSPVLCHFSFVEFSVNLENERVCVREREK